MPKFKFDMSAEARQFNSDQLELHDYDMEKLLLANQGTTLGFSSEFQPLEQLEPLLGQHPNFPAAKS